jgi:hypothetical protein
MADSSAAATAPLQPPGKMTVTLHVNGVERRLTITPWTTLLDALRLSISPGPRKAATTAGCVYRKPRPFDLKTESLNLGDNGRADIPLLEPGCLALQVQEPT